MEEKNRVAVDVKPGALRHVFFFLFSEWVFYVFDFFVSLSEKCLVVCVCLLACRKSVWLFDICLINVHCSGILHQRFRLLYAFFSLLYLHLFYLSYCL